MLKKILIGVVALIIVVIAAAFIAPAMIDWRPRIAAAFHDATGRELKIDGPVHVAILPSISVSASGVHVANAPGASRSDLLSVSRLSLQAELWPLLTKHLVVDSLTIERPVAHLEVDKAGRANWAFGPSDRASAKNAGGGNGGFLADITVKSFKLENGQISYSNAATGQTVEAKDVSLSAANTALDRPSTLIAKMTLNNEPVAADLSVATLGKLASGESARVKLALTTKRVTARFDGSAQRRPVPGLNGTFDLDIPSVGALATWLGRPLGPGRRDPGPLKVHAVFAAAGAKSTLKEATITGTNLSAKASGSIDASGAVTKINADLESGVLDIDRYLPERAAAPQPARAAPTARLPSLLKDPFAGLSDRPFDLQPLRKLDAHVKVAIAGIRAKGYSVGRIAFDATAKNGILTTDLSEDALHGGKVTGRLKFDGSGSALGVDGALRVDRVAVDQLMPAASVTGVVSATLDAKGQGRSPRALAEDMRGHLALDLGGVKVRSAAAREISRLKLAIDFPGAQKPPSLKASLVYKGEKIDAQARLAPVREMATAARFPAALKLSSKLMTARYDGAVQRRPVPGLDGTFDLDVPSVAKLAAWMDRPLGAGSPDPGPLKVHAVLASDGTKLTLKSAAITGKALKATAHGSLDRSREPASFDVKIALAHADLNAYLPKEAPARAGGRPRAQPQRGSQKASSGWSTAPFNLASLAAANGKAELSLAKVRYRNLDITRGDIKLALLNRVLKITAEKLALARGTVDTSTTLDASGRALKFAYRAAVAGVQAEPLLEAFAGSDRLSGTLAFDTALQGSGRNEMELISSLNGSGHFKVTNGAINGFNLAQILRNAGKLGFGTSTTQKTDFAELGGSFTVKSGVIENRDLSMLAPVLRVTGAGTVPMPQRSVDYRLEAKLVPTLAGQGGNKALEGLPIPIKVTGPWSGLRWQIDWASVFRTIASDPSRLKNLPSNLRDAAKNYGANLPSLPGGTNLPGILKNIPGSQPQQQGPSAPSPLPFKVPGGLFGK